MCITIPYEKNKSATVFVQGQKYITDLQVHNLFPLVQENFKDSSRFRKEKEIGFPFLWTQNDHCSIEHVYKVFMKMFRDSV